MNDEINEQEFALFMALREKYEINGNIRTVQVCNIMDWYRAGYVISQEIYDDRVYYSTIVAGHRVFEYSALYAPHPAQKISQPVFMAPGIRDAYSSYLAQELEGEWEA